MHIPMVIVHPGTVLFCVCARGHVEGATGAGKQSSTCADV